MTPQEAQMLQDLVRKVEGTQLTEKDPDAEALLYDGLARDPDALYKLAQTVLVQSLALDQARAQIDQLRQQPVPAQQPARATSFLGGLFGHREQAPPQQPPQYQYQQVPQYQAVPQYGPGPGYAPVEYVPAQAPSGAGSFLRSAATTAAGVAAGALAFEGIESLMHGGFGHGPEFGGGYGPGFEGGYGGRPEETVINNYYGDSNAQSGERYEGGSNGPDMQPQGPYEDDSNGPDMQPQGPYEEEASYDSGGDSNFDDSSFGDDSNLI